MRTRELISGAAAGVVGGYVGTKVMNPVTTKLYELAPEADKAREKAVSPGSPYRIGVQKGADLLGVKLTEEQLSTGAAVAPYVVGVTGGVLYVGLRRLLHLNPLVAGLISAMALFIVVDEGLTPALGLSAPDRAYPMSTHLRGFIGHLAYGAAVAATAEVLLGEP